MSNEGVRADPFDIEGQEHQLVGQQAKEKERRRQEVEDIKWMMAHKAGRRIMWRLLAQAGVYRTSFTGNSETFFREGRRDMGLFFLDEVHNHCPDAYVTMLKEQRNET